MSLSMSRNKKTAVCTVVFFWRRVRDLAPRCGSGWARSEATLWPHSLRARSNPFSLMLL